MIDWSQQYIETNPAERAQFLWVSVFYYMTSQVIDDYGQAGENCIRKVVVRHLLALRDYRAEAAVPRGLVLYRDKLRRLSLAV